MNAETKYFVPLKSSQFLSRDAPGCGSLGRTRCSRVIGSCTAFWGLSLFLPIAAPASVLIFRFLVPQSDEQMVWRADIRTPRILATALEKLADLANDPAQNDPSKFISGTEVQKTTETQQSRREILENGGEVRTWMILPCFPWLNLLLHSTMPSRSSTI